MLVRLEVLLKKMTLSADDEELVKEFLNEIDKNMETKAKAPKSAEKVEVTNIPKPLDSVSLKKPAWLPLAYAPLKPIKEVLDEINATLKEMNRRQI